MPMTAMPKIMTLTDTAASRVRNIMSSSGDDITGIRIGVKNGGCAGMEYTMEYAANANIGDDVIEDKGVKLFVDPKAILFLLGTEMDYTIEKLSSGFRFNNPNQTSACGCGESVELTPANIDALNAFEKPMGAE